MGGDKASVLIRLVDRVFPRMPDFYTLLNEQCDLAVKAMEVFVQFIEDGSADKAREVRAMEKRGDRLKARNLDILNRSFSTPIDREDIYRAIASIDHIVNYAKTTTREIEALKLQPDVYMLELAVGLQGGTYALQRGYRKLSSEPAHAEEDAQAARKAERNAEKVYRRALADLFSPERYLEELQDQETNNSAKAVTLVVEMFKRREVYRHLSNAADRLARAGEVLHDIVVKIS